MMRVGLQVLVSQFIVEQIAGNGPECFTKRRFLWKAGSHQRTLRWHIISLSNWEELVAEQNEMAVLKLVVLSWCDLLLTCMTAWLLASICCSYLHIWKWTKYYQGTVKSPVICPSRETKPKAQSSLNSHAWCSSTSIGYPASHAPCLWVSQRSQYGSTWTFDICITGQVQVDSWMQIRPGKGDKIQCMLTSLFLLPLRPNSPIPCLPYPSLPFSLHSAKVLQASLQWPACEQMLQPFC